MELYIKNSDTVNHTYEGQQILPSAYYQVDQGEFSRWQNNSQLIIDVANGLATVAKSNSGSDDLTDVNDGINYLKGINQIQKTQSILTQDGLTARPIGFNFTATKNSTTTHYFLVDEAVSLRGGFLETLNHEFGDEFSFDIEDKDGVYYPAGTVLSAFVKNWQCRASGENEIKDESISDALPLNVYYRLTYKSTGTTNDVKGGLTIYAYK